MSNKFMKLAEMYATGEKPKEQPPIAGAATCYVAGLIELQTAVTEHILEMDKVMKGPSTYKRGRSVAQLVSTLQEALTESQKPHNAPHEPRRE